MDGRWATEACSGTFLNRSRGVSDEQGVSCHLRGHLESGVQHSSRLYAQRHAGHVRDLDHRWRKHWRSRRLDTSQAAPSSLACWSASDCLLGGYSSDLMSSSQSLAVTTDGGSHWTSLRVPGALDGTQQITCLPPDECLAIVGSSVMKTADAGADWATSL